MYAAASFYQVKFEDENASDGGGSPTALLRAVTANYFNVLDARPVVGRTFAPDDDRVEHGRPVAVISYRFWERNFGSTGVIGRGVRLNGSPFTIIGVSPPHFFGDVVGENMDIFVPLTMQAEIMRGQSWYESWNTSWLQIVARLKPATGLIRARAEVNVAFQHMLAGKLGAVLDSAEVKTFGKSQISVVDGSRGLSAQRSEYREPLLLLMAMVGIVLLIACANIAALLLSRASKRNKEVALRLAIGASPARIVRQLLTESVVLAAVGGIAGAMFATWGVRLLLRVVETDLLTSPSRNIFAFTAGVSLLSGVIFGLAPALRSTQLSIITTLRESRISGQGSGSKWGWGKALVAGQVALSFFALFCAGLLVRSVRNLQNVDTGYKHEHLLLVHLSPAAAGHDVQEIANLARQLMQRVSDVPGVRAMTFSENGLFSGTDGRGDIIVPGYTASPSGDQKAFHDEIGPAYFSTLGIPIIAGREINARDTAGSPDVAVINQTMANFYFHNQNPVGRVFYIDDAKYRTKPIEIVGVVRDSKQRSLRRPAERRYYLPFFQKQDRRMGINLEVEAVGKPSTIVAAVRRQIQATDPSLPVPELTAMEDLINISLFDLIAMAKLAGTFAVLALLLACMGLYGVMAYAIANRTQEIGMRMALGAQRVQIFWLVMRESAIVTGAGILVGIPAAVLGSRFLESMVFGVSNFDPASMAIVVLIIGLVALLSGYLPAYRAIRVDPQIALRSE
jgi:predicted permease